MYLFSGTVELRNMLRQSICCTVVLKLCSNTNKWVGLSWS